MAQDDHTSRCSNSSSGGGGAGAGGGGGGGGSSNRSSKKLKHKKVPQRGMGVAQLEKIISEEQQKKDATVLTQNSIPPPPPPPLPPPPNGGGGGGNWYRLWSDGYYSFEGEKQSQIQSKVQNHGLDHPRYTASFPANLMLQRSQNFQQPCSSTMEPPSNQSYSGNNYHHLYPEEDKIAGMKRPYPFSLENAPIPSFHCKFPSAYVTDEPASCSNGGTIIKPASNPSSSGAIADENERLTRDFLKLAPPQSSQSNSCSNENQFENFPPQKGPLEGLSHVSGRGGSKSHLLPFLGFFPPAKTPIGQAGDSNGEAGEGVDLNLKL